MQSEKMPRTELRAGTSLAAVFGLRMLGLFIILPVFAVHAPGYEGGGNLTLVGVVGTQQEDEIVRREVFGPWSR